MAATQPASGKDLTMTKAEEDSIKKLDRRTVTTYAVIQFTFYCRLRQMGADATKQLEYLREVGFDVVTREDGTWGLIENKPTKKTT